MGRPPWAQARRADGILEVDRRCGTRCLTRDTLGTMPEASIRDLRNHGGEVVDRATRGERITITRAGRAVAELRAISPPALSAETLLRHWRQLPQLDPAALRGDIDRLLDTSV
jgi:antitoxin (DNA-binding transcriptional repressor) of toxin-antitoxin stability system